MALMVGTRTDGTKVKFLFFDIGLLSDGSAFRARVVIDGVDHDIDVARRHVDIHGPKFRAAEERAALRRLGIEDFKQAEDANAA